MNVLLQRILKAHYKKKYKLNDTFHQFRGQFCINEAIAKIENNLLITAITQKWNIKLNKQIDKNLPGVLPCFGREETTGCQSIYTFCKTSSLVQSQNNVKDQSHIQVHIHKTHFQFLHHKNKSIWVNSFTTSEKRQKSQLTYFFTSITKKPSHQ